MHAAGRGRAIRELSVLFAFIIPSRGEGYAGRPEIDRRDFHVAEREREIGT